jgi:hypothetical protein
MRGPYRGLGRVTVQVLMTLILANAKKMAKLLTSPTVGTVHAPGRLPR